MKKRVFLFLLISILSLSFSACGNTVVYDEEKAINEYINKATKGYLKLDYDPPFDVYTLHDDKSVLTVKLDKGAKLIPSLSVAADKNRNTITESEILSVNVDIDGETVLYGSGNAKSQYYDPYEGKNLPNMRVYKKDESNFRVMFFVFNELEETSDAFYGFTGDVYEKIVSAIENFSKDAEHAYKYKDYLEKDYLEIFKAMYIPYSSNKEKLDEKYGDLFDIEKLEESNSYLLDEVSEDYKFFSDIIFKEYYPYTVQDSRINYGKMGYKGYSPDLIIVPVDISIADGGVSISGGDDVFYSEKARNNGYEYSFRICPQLTE